MRSKVRRHFDKFSRFLHLFFKPFFKSNFAHVKKNIMYKNFILKSSFIVSVALILSSCSKGGDNQAYNQQPPELPIGVISQQDVTIPREYAASIEGVSTVEIRPQVSGYLSRIFVDEGDYVRAGQALFKIEDRIFSGAVEKRAGYTYFS